MTIVFAMSKYKTDHEFLKAVGANLRKIRLEKGVSQEELAFRTNMTLAQIGRFERGEVNSGISILSFIAKALGIEPSELIKIQ